MLNALVLSNGIAGLERYFPSGAGATYRFARVAPGFRLDLDGTDLLIVPNGADHVAMLGVRDQVRAFLDAGGAVLCSCGWFTDWVPGNRWVHDNEKATRDIRYRVRDDRHGLFAGVDVEPFVFRNGISGWWACGYIEPARQADVLLEDTWGRAMIVLDERTTPGLLFLTASGPLGPGDSGSGKSALGTLYANVLELVQRRRVGRPVKAAAAAAVAASRAVGPWSEEPAGRRIGLVFNGVWSQYAFAMAPKYRHLYRLVYVHDLTWERIRDLDALVIPFQSNQEAIAERQDALYRFLAKGGKIAVFGDSTPLWLDALWEDRPVDNYWWVTDPTRPPVANTDSSHPVYRGLQPRHSCWHVHGVYTRVPETAEVVQTNEAGEVITWQTHRYGGTLFASTLDPIVEHGIQQIRHLDHYCDSLTAWLCGVKPEGRFTIDPDAFGRPENGAARAVGGVLPPG